MRNFLVIPLVALTLSGCANLMSSVTSGLADDLSHTILNSQDVETVREGIPAYLLMIDSFLRSSPDNSDLLLAAANLNGAFANFTNESRAALLTAKALNYAMQAGCLESKRLCNLRGASFPAFQAQIAALQVREVPLAFAIGVAWTGWIQAHGGDWNAVAELSRVKSVMGRVIELNESFDQGGPHLYMGGLETILPASMGGNPEKGKQHFDRALILSEGKNLMTKVVYAEQYARLIFDQSLHDRLLQEVIDADPVAEGMTLINTYAQQRAQGLLQESSEYF